MASQSVVLLSVGGQLFTTTTTLTAPPVNGSMLERLIELNLERQKLRVEHPAVAASMQPTLSDPRHPDALLIDRDGSTFNCILNYLR